ncbi:MAG: SprT-like domain-containing protein [Oligoflexia bacterium]|nr:SprT-like domain-containing protein [Oligoflexia bacterium]
MDLEQIFLELNTLHFQQSLPTPLLQWNKKLRTTAGRFSPGSKRFAFARLAKIEIADYLKALPEGSMHVRDTILHEMIHYYLWFHNRPYGHTPEFHKIMKTVGAKRYNPVPQLTEVKHWYYCKNCGKEVPTRRRLKESACLDCCKKWNRGKYSNKYALVRSHEKKEKNLELVAAHEASPTVEKILSKEEIFSKIEQIKRAIWKSPHS